MNRISTKLATYFFIVVLIMESFFMFYLHQNIIRTRIQEEYTRLLATGSNHRDVLTENYSETTLHHIVLMEKDEDREVMVIDRKGNVINSSSTEATFLNKYVPLLKRLQKQKDTLWITDWERSPYVVSVHPYKLGGRYSGYVVMFQSTNAIHQMVGHLNKHFVIAGATSVVMLLVVYAMLSKILTRPLVRMKEATEKLSMGDFQVSLPRFTNDELGELGSSIQKLANDLQRLQKERNDFLASVAHELSTPLTYLIGYSKVAMRKELSEKEREHYLTILIEESNRMQELVKNLLDLAKMDENSFTVVKANFEACPFFEALCQRVAPSFEMKKVTLSFLCSDDFQVHADKIRLEQIVLNLLDNALKYSNEYTEVQLQVQQNEGKTVIAVMDSGIGIPEAELNYIFEKLYRVEKSRSRSFGGAGIGLAVVKELVEAHGGTIKVRSELGKGSTFVVTI